MFTVRHTRNLLSSILLCYSAQAQQILVGQPHSWLIHSWQGSVSPHSLRGSER